MAAKKSKSSAAVIGSPELEHAADATNVDAGAPFVGRWNRLVSTTNWEKGKIIAQWRDALVASGAAVSDYSDEAWAQIVGGVTSQHIGRLRRVFQRFGGAFEQYDGLYWSHFQAGIDWEDAEMWLEGAILNNWSVSQMRGKRWETVGKPGEEPPFDDADETGEAAGDEEMADADDEMNAIGATAVEKSIDAPKKREAAEDSDDDSDEEPTARSESGSADRETSTTSAKSRNRLSVEVDELPEDLADAFEQFKLAIIAQRRLGWSETTPDAVIECLDALRELTLAPADN